MKKGFTLIELLAVIVILAIIALITVPVVINIINNSKKGAAEDSTYGVIESAKLYWTSNQSVSLDASTDIIFTCNESGVCSSNGNILEMTGTKPTGGKIKIVNGIVSVENLKFGDYYCNTNSQGKVSCLKETESVTYVYYGTDTSAPTTVSAASQTRPTEYTIYFKYPVLNNTLGTPQACTYYNNKEVCINNHEKDTSVSKIQTEYGITCSNSNCLLGNTTIEVFDNEITMEDATFSSFVCQMYQNDQVICHN